MEVIADLEMLFPQRLLTSKVKEKKMLKASFLLHVLVVDRVFRDVLFVKDEKVSTPF